METNVVIAITVAEVLVFCFQLWALVTAFRYPAWAWTEARHSRGTWILLLILAFFLAWCGVILSAWFLIGPSSDVRNVAKLGRRPGMPGAL